MGSSSSYILLLPSNPKFSSSSSVKFGKSVIRIISASSCATTSKSRTTSSSSSLYDVLGIHSGATSKDIKTAYRRLARLVHPDASAAAAYGDSGEEFIRIHAAYSTLSDPVKRADYDVSHSHSHRRFSRYYAAKPRRTWETDQCW